MIGVFDSGFGGLTVVRALRRVLPEHDLLFFADQAHVPYGNRSYDDLRHLLAVNVAYLERAGSKFVVMGCNTSCAVGGAGGWPRTDVPILDLIESAALSVAASGARNVAVVATAATVRSDAYPRLISRFAPGVQIEQIAAPALVPLVEAGQAATPQARDAVKEVLQRLNSEYDALVLGCTHYPFLEAHFRALLPGVALIDPAIEQAARAVKMVRGHEFPAGGGRTRFVTSGDRAAFAAGIESLLGPLDEFEEVEEYPHRDAA